MKREFLEGLDLGDGAKLSKEAIEAIMAEHGKTKTALDNTITALTTERDTLKTQLGEANEAIKGFEKLDVDGIKAKAEEWETKYNTDTQALKDQLAAKEYDYSVNDAVTGLKFTSESARKAFVADLTAKKLPVQDGKLLGLDDFVKEYQTADPNAFDSGDPAPRVVSKTGGGNTDDPGSALRAAMGLPPVNEKE